MNKWDYRFIKLAKEIASWSKDPSTKVGAIAVNDKRIIATGYNGFPKGIEDSNNRLSDRETKLAFMVHAEKKSNLQCNLSRSMSKKFYSLYLWPPML